MGRRGPWRLAWRASSLAGPARSVNPHQLFTVTPRQLFTVTSRQLFTVKSRQFHHMLGVGTLRLDFGGNFSIFQPVISLESTDEV